MLPRHNFEKRAQDSSNLLHQNNSYISDSYGKHEGAAIISLPYLSESNSKPKKRKSKLKETIKRRNVLNMHLNLSSDAKLNNIQEEAVINQNVEPNTQSTSNIRVAIRLRPLSKQEIEDNQFEIVQIVDQKIVVLKDPLEILNKKDELSKNRSKERHFTFDTAFDKENGQIEIFNNTTKYLIDGILDGFNATVFAYGATGAGKTYTMIGTAENPGNMFLTIKELFDAINKSRSNKNFQLKVSFLEIYNETIRDLLIITNDVLDMREDADQGIHIPGLSVIDVESPEEVMELLIFGNANRTQEATNVNETSSRSHAVLEIQVEQK